MSKGGIAALAIGLIAVGGASYLVNRWLSHEPAHDSPAPHRTSGSAASDALARPASHSPPHPSLIHGTRADDVLVGTASGERIRSLGGDDRIEAGAGNDVLEGGTGADVLAGGAGDDAYVVQLRGGGTDVIVEEDGDDTLQFAGGRLSSSGIDFLRHGDDLVLRWDPKRPTDAVIVRSWFVAPGFRVERLQLPRGALIAPEPLAAGARPAPAEDLTLIPPKH